MKNKDLIKRLSLLDPEHDVLVSAADGGEPYGIGHVAVDEWDDGDGEAPTPIILLGIIT